MKNIVLIKCGSYNDGSFWGVINKADENSERIRQIAEAIKSNPDRWNWTMDTKPERQGGEWVSVRKVYDMYPSISRETLDWFSSCLPWRTETIEEIWEVWTDHENRLL